MRIAFGRAVLMMLCATVPAAAMAQQPDVTARAEALATVPLPSLRGIVFLDRPEDLREAGWTAPDGAAAIDVSRVPALDAAMVRSELMPLIGAPLTAETLGAVRHTVAVRYASLGRPFVASSTPEQDVTNGWLQVVVVEARLGALRVEGNRWFRADAFTKPLGMKPGDPIDAGRLDDAVRWINLNVFRRVVPVASEGDAFATTDLTLQVQDRFPVAASVSAGNGGSVATGETQFSAGVEWANAFGRGDTAYVRATTADDLDVMRQVSAGYTFNLPWRDQLAISGSVSRTAPASRGSLFGAVGEMSGATARYIWLGRGRRAGVTTMSVALDWKRTNNDLLFGGESVFASTAGIAQVVADVSNRWSSRLGATSAYLSATFSPGDLVADNDDETFDTQRQGATARYAYFRASLVHSVPLPARFVWHTRLGAQLSNARLLSSEQLSFGGDGSIRGLPASAATRDEGLTASLEIETPAVAGLFRGDWPRDQITGLLFVDYGLGWQHDQRAAPKVRALTAGPALRYQIGRFSWTQVAFGWVLDDDGVSGVGRGRLHVTTQVSF